MKEFLEKLKGRRRYVVIVAVVAAALAAFLGGEMTLQQAVDHVLSGVGASDVKMEGAK